MSFAIATTNLASATAGSSGTVDWSAIAQSIGFPNSTDTPHLQLYNESPCELRLTMSTGEQFVLPAGGWQNIPLNAQCTRLTYEVLAVLNANPIVALLLGTWYAPDEVVPNIPVLGNSPIGATVAISPIANELQGVGQSLGFTEFDSSGTPMLLPFSGTTQGMIFASLDGSGNRVPQIQIDPNALNPRTIFLTNVLFNTGVQVFFAAGSSLVLPTTINSVPVTGTGVPLVVASSGPTVISSTATQTLIDYTPTVNGLYRASMGLALNNGTSGQTVLATVIYSAQGAAGSHRFAGVQAGGTTVVVLDGATSRTNSDYALQPFTFYATTGGHIQIMYRDPANTPNDTVSACIERLV